MEHRVAGRQDPIIQQLRLDMSEPRNIQIFEELVGRILDRLYRNFPNPVLVDVREMGQEVAVVLDSPEEEQFRILTADSLGAMNFLAKEGFVDYQPNRRHLEQPEAMFPESVLTMKGFTLLGTVPAAVNETIERRPIAEQLSEALNEGARGTVGELVKKLFTGALTMGASAIGA